MDTRHLHAVTDVSSGGRKLASMLRANYVPRGPSGEDDGNKDGAAVREVGMKKRRRNRSRGRKRGSS